ncbi:type II CAAX prenyl endopeptidase Rce1 family protein [Bacteroidota bacterium]
MTLSKIKKLSLEFFLLFILFPIILTLKIFIAVKLIISLLAIFYVGFIIHKTKIKLFKSIQINWEQHLKRIALLFCGLIIITSGFLYATTPEKLFYVVLQKPKLWLAILVVYSLLSVLPQEIIYRSFFFHRYSNLFPNKILFLFINAIVFSMGHLFFHDLLVTMLTFVGGFLFAFTFYKSKSLVLVTIEHIIYGCWLFTVGMGDLLGFPS